MIARIAVEGLFYSIDKPYSYRVPSELQLQPGMRVSIPFGRGNRAREGMILTLEHGDEEGLKAVSAALDTEPVLNERMLRLAAFVRERYYCTLYDAIRAMLPAGIWLKNRTIWEVGELPEDWADRLEADPAASGVLRLLQEAGGCLSEEALIRQTGAREQTLRALAGLRDRRWIQSRTELLKKSADKSEKILHCAAGSEQIAEFCQKKRKSAPMQAAVKPSPSTKPGEPSATDTSSFTSGVPSYTFVAPTLSSVTGRGASVHSTVRVPVKLPVPATVSE